MMWRCMELNIALKNLNKYLKLKYFYHSKLRKKINLFMLKKLTNVHLYNKKLALTLSIQFRAILTFDCEKN
jgi:hypothetical protein